MVRWFPSVLPIDTMLHGSNGTETQTKPKKTRSSRKTQRVVTLVVGYCTEFLPIWR